MNRIQLPERIRAQVPSGIEQESADTAETAEQAQERRQAAFQHRLTRWERRLPTRYRDARVRDLSAEQCRGGIEAWIEAGNLTLLMVGKPGLGKTHAAYAVGRALLEAGVWTECWTATALMIALRPDGDSTAREDVLDCTALVLDDLGRENSSGWTIEQLHHLLDVRVAERRRTVVTTNLAAEQITDRYGTAFFDRLRDDAHIMRFEGRSRRRPAAW
jgi:DNA replication protein DnaC